MVIRMKADKNKVANLLKTARGQIEGVLKMIEEDRYCVDISNQLMATEAVIKKANNEILKEHMKFCVKEALESDNVDEKIDELIQLVTRVKS